MCILLGIGIEDIKHSLNLKSTPGNLVILTIPHKSAQFNI